MKTNKALRFVLVLITIMLAITTISGVSAQEEESATLELADYGPYEVGRMEMTFVDETREDRAVRIQIWYPALRPEEGRKSLGGFRDAAPDVSDAPYPLVLASHGYGGTDRSLGESQYGDWAGHLVSHGFVLAAPNHSDRGIDTGVWRLWVDRPADILFVLNQLAELDEGDLVGVFDADQVGVWGYSIGGYATVAMTGVYIDPTYLRNWCAEMGRGRINRRLCEVMQHWDEFAELIAPVGLETDAPWPPFSDERIAAAVAIAPGYGPLFGEDGLAAATVPTFFIGATQDWDTPYERDAVFMYTHFGTEDRYFLSLIGAAHVSVFSSSFLPFEFHFLAAFFGYYLKGQEEYAQYLTAEFVEQFEEVAWGVYEDE